MTTNQLLIYVIVGLVGIILGGSVPTFMRKAFKVDTGIVQGDDAALQLAATAASTAAAITAAAFRDELTKSMDHVQTRLDTYNNNLETLNKDFNRLCGATEERNKAVDKRLDTIELYKRS